MSTVVFMEHFVECALGQNSDFKRVNFKGFTNDTSTQTLPVVTDAYNR